MCDAASCLGIREDEKASASGKRSSGRLRAQREKQQVSLRRAFVAQLSCKV